MTGSQSQPGETPKRITCRECAEFLGDYIDGALPKVQRVELERHLRKCPQCVTFIEQYKRTIELAKSCICNKDSGPKVPPPEELVRAILAARSQPPTDSPSCNQ